MKIQVKISGEQVTALLELSKNMVIRGFTPQSAAQKMVKALLLEVHTKLHAKALFPKEKITLSLTPAQGYAFMLLWDRIDLKEYPYEDAIIRYIISQIDQKL